MRTHTWRKDHVKTWRNKAIYSSRPTLGRNNPAKDLISGSSLRDSVKISFCHLNRCVCGTLLWLELSEGRVYYYFLRSWLLFCYLYHHFSCTHGADRVPSTIFCWLETALHTPGLLPVIRNHYRFSPRCFPFLLDHDVY